MCRWRDDRQWNTGPRGLLGRLRGGLLRRRLGFGGRFFGSGLLGRRLLGDRLLSGGRLGLRLGGRLGLRGRLRGRLLGGLGRLGGRLGGLGRPAVGAVDADAVDATSGRRRGTWPSRRAWRPSATWPRAWTPWETWPRAWGSSSASPSWARACGSRVLERTRESASGRRVLLLGALLGRRRLGGRLLGLGRGPVVGVW